MSAQQAQVLDNQQLSPPIDYQFLGDNETLERKRQFLDHLRECAAVYTAAKRAGIARCTVYRWYESDPQFAQAWADALQDASDVMETSIYEDALGTPEKSGNALLKMFWAKAHMPKYKDKITIDVSAVQEQIDSMMSRIEGVERLQLPPATTSFIDTGYSEDQREYKPIPSTSDNQQKDEPPSES